MEKFDEQLEKRVWERIHGEGQVRSLQSLAVSERGNAAAYLRLTRMTQGAQKICCGGCMSGNGSMNNA
jgi:hypothetical protein